MTTFGNHYEHHCELCDTTHPELYGYTSRQVPPGWGFLDGKKACYVCMEGKRGNRRGRTGTMSETSTPYAVLAYLYRNAYLKRLEFIRETHMSPTLVAQALCKLVKIGRAAKTSRGVYRITKQGRDFMERETV